MKSYISASISDRQSRFATYLSSIGLKESTQRSYLNYCKNNAVIDGIVKAITGSTTATLFNVTDITIATNIFNKVSSDPANKKAHNAFSAGVKYYLDFLGFLTGTPHGVITPVKPPVTTAKDFSVKEVISLISATGLQYDSLLVKRFAFSLMTKPFVILSGLAGSGKTQLALAFAKALIEDDSQLCTVSVGADWTNREPLLGYPNALKSGEYVRPESGVLDLLIEANKTENARKPYFLILDEMNMSYVERYFADFLSSMESRESIKLWGGSSEPGSVPASVKLPKNLFIIGTINVDETTYMFSPKVLDRANVIEFKISEDEMSNFLSDIKSIDRDSIFSLAAGMAESFISKASSAAIKPDTTIQSTLIDFFKELKSVNAEFGYRSASEIYRYIDIARKNDDTPDDDTILDCAMVQKLLPKLHGSRKKLDPVLKALWGFCCSSAKLDEAVSVPEDAKYPLTADKVLRMYRSALDNGFTSYSEA